MHLIDIQINRLNYQKFYLCFTEEQKNGVTYSATPFTQIVFVTPTGFRFKPVTF